MRISNKFSYVFYDEHLKISLINGNNDYFFNKTGNILLKSYLKSKNLKQMRLDLLEKYASFENTESVFNKFISFMFYKGLIDNKIIKNQNEFKHLLKEKNKFGKEIFENSQEYLQKITSKNNNRIPSVVQIEIEGLCNFNCCYCINNGPKNYINGLKLSIDKLEEIFYDLESLGVSSITFSGGEPFLRNDILDILELTKKFGFTISIYTNASLINNSIIEKLKEIRLKSLQISIYGNNEDYDTFTNTKNMHNLVLENLSKLKNENIPLYIVCPLTKINKSSFEYFESLEKHYQIVYNFLIDNPFLGKNKNIAELISLDYNDPFLIRKVKNTVDNINFPETNCSIGYNQLVIDVNGNVYPCFSFPISIGNIHINSLIDIWNNDFIIGKIREYNEKRKMKTCEKCSANNVCSKCMAKCLAYTGKFDQVTKEVCREGKYIKRIKDVYADL